MDHTLAQSFQFCREIARRSNSSFYATFFALPKDLFRDTCVLYAFMRLTDDIGDEPGPTTAERRNRLRDWRARLERSTAGASQLPDEPIGHPTIFPAVAHLLKNREIPLQWLLEVIDGVERDLDPQPFSTWVELEHYCYQVAGVVGLCCIQIWGHSKPQAHQLAIDCGTAFQLTNIIRDLKEDAERGRLYLPLQDMDQFGCDVNDFLSPQVTDNLRLLVQSQVERAQEYYHRAAPLTRLLSPPGARVYAAMQAAYHGLLIEMKRRNYDVLTQRVRLPTWKRWQILMFALCPGL